MSALGPAIGPYEHPLLGTAERSLRARWIRLLWIAFLAIPIIQIAGTNPTVLDVVLQVLGVAVFFAVAGRSMARGTWAGALPLRDALPQIALIVGATVLLSVFGVSSWSILFPGACIFAVRLLPTSLLLPGVFVISLIAAASALAGAGGWSAVSIGAATFGLGVMTAMIRVTMDKNAELREAQDELARLAVADERLRFARDMHDLVGHSLSVIALKAELAGRLTETQPDEARRHVAEIEGVARAALTEVRDVVSGYRRPLLQAELAGARMALHAAGIDLEVADAQVDLEPAAEAVLAWTVREGTTNVIRHSGARRCTIVVTNRGERAAVEVVDDGTFAPDARDVVLGNGLAGLRERAAEVGGTVEASAAEAGGYRLRVTVPA